MSPFKGVRWLLALSAMFAVLSLLAACQPLGQRSQRANEDWSRGLRLGRASVNNAVALAPQPDGSRVFLAWVTQRAFDGAQLIHFCQLDDAGAVVSERDLDMEPLRPTLLRLVLVSNGVRLFWVDTVDGQRTLLHALLDDRGRSLAQPAALMVGLPVETYDLAPAPEGALDIVASVIEGERVGLHLLRLGADGSVVSPPAALAIKGIDPALRVDAAGTRHLLWAQQPSYGQRDLLYADLASDGTLRAQTTLASYPIGVGLVAHPPELALAGESTYAFWSIERRGGGMSAPAADTFYLSFPSGRPDLARAARQVAIPPWNHPTYAAVESPYGPQHRASAASGDIADFVYFARAAAAQGAELPVAFSVQLSGRTQSIVQIVASYWQAGQIAGYQVVGQTSTSSLRPVLAVDDARALHLAWIDTAGFGAYDVYYASTAAKVRARLNRVTVADVRDRLLVLLWGVVQAMGFVPVVLAWSLLPLVMVVAYVFFVPEAYMWRLGSRVMLVAAIVPYVLLKYSLRPGWLMDLPIPQGLTSQTTNAILLAAPVVISGLAVAVTLWFAHRRRETTILAAFGLFVLTDALLTLLLYVPGVLAE